MRLRAAAVVDMVVASVGDMLAGAREVGSELIMPEKALLSDELRDRAREAGIKVRKAG